MKKIKHVFYLFLLTVLHSCSQSDKNLDDIRLLTNEEGRFSILPDTTFFAQVTDITNTPSGLVFCDYKSSRVAKLQIGNNSVESISGIGKGPGDIFGPSISFSSGHSIYVYEEMNRRISHFDSQLNYLNSYSNSFDGYLSNKFIIDEFQYLFCSVRIGDSTFLKINLNNPTDRTYFGQPSITPYISQSSHLLRFEDYIIACKLSDPLIEIYDRHTLELVNQFWYNQYRSVQSRIDFAQQKLAEKGNPPNITYQLVSQVKIYENNLLILIVDNLEDKPVCNKILLFKLLPKAIQYQGTIVFPENSDIRWITAFEVFDKGKIILHTAQYETAIFTSEFL